MAPLDQAVGHSYYPFKRPAGMAAGEVLFVNKTASSGTLSRSRGLERAKIFSHVQRSSFNRASTSTKDLQKLTAAPKKKEKSKQDESLSEDASKIIARRAGRDVKFAINTKEITKLAKNTSSTDIRTPLSLNMLIARRPDPFETTAAPCSFYMDCLLKFFASDILPRIYPVKTMADISRKSTMSMSFQDPMLMFTLLSTTAASMYCASQLKTHAVAAMTFKVRAIEALNARLSQPKSAKVSLSTVNTVALLLWLECLQGNAADLRAHAAGLNHLVGQLEDLREIPLPVLATVLACSYFCSAYLQIRPKIQPIILSANNISRTAKSLLDQSRNPFYTGLASKFFIPSNLTILGPHLASIAIEQRANILLREELSRPDTTTTYSDVNSPTRKKSGSITLSHHYLSITLSRQLKTRYESLYSCFYSRLYW
ncbi:hypothetical protein HII31_00683 [Pseudocercospora fuligena]|uniref:Uncharacterized protein n=1 Tax=Pseudocercospora fuligena TaxID=685502 RepID=A0A8H6VRL0_9PEZI|nr:hypothetical protein HII31_00683 [Pseudocercospora fuligena]